MYENLVFSGGGVKCISYVSILKYIEENSQYFNVKKIAATSGGSIYALCYCLGYSYKDLSELILHIKMDSLVDIDLANFLENFGIDSGKKLEYFIKLMIKKKGNNENITLLEFFNKYQYTFTTTGVCLNTHKVEYFNYKTHPSMPLYMAISISCAIPFFYKNIEYENKTYVDGGLLNYYPINLFEEELDKTIGFYIDSPKNSIQFKNSLEEYILNLFECVSDYMYFCKPLYQKYTIFINCEHFTSQFGAVEFTMDRDTKEKIINQSYTIIVDYFTTRQSNDTSTSNNATSEDIQVASEDIQATSEDIQVASEDIQATSEDIQVASEDIQVASEDIQATSEDIQATLTEDMQVASEDI